MDVEDKWRGYICVYIYKVRCLPRGHVEGVENQIKIWDIRMTSFPSSTSTLKTVQDAGVGLPVCKVRDSVGGEDVGNPFGEDPASQAILVLQTLSSNSTILFSDLLSVSFNSSWGLINRPVVFINKPKEIRNST